ncbi:hypothetical protein AX14_007902, partial [Amanita brunnescens Koide BX004]
MDLHTGPPPGLPRPKTSPPPPHSSSPHSPPSSHPVMASPAPQRPTSSSWASSLAAGLFPAAPLFPQPPPQVPHGLLPSNAAVQTAVALHNNSQITDLGSGLSVPVLSDPWHRAHARVCAHASVPCAACSVSLLCCTCRALRFTPGPPPVSPSAPAAVPRSFSASPGTFRSNVGNGSPPPDFDSYDYEHNDDDAYARALAECDTCDNISCPRGTDEPATYSITVEQFDEGSEETYDRIFRACSACNRSCKKSFMGHNIKSRSFDNSTRETFTKREKLDTAITKGDGGRTARRAAPVPGSAAYAHEHPADEPMPSHTPPVRASSVPPPTPTVSAGTSLEIVNKLQYALRTLNARPPTPAAFVATICVKHDADCLHHVSSCPIVRPGRRPAPHMHKMQAHRFYAIAPVPGPARRFYGGAGSDPATSNPTSSPEPDIWTPSPR